MVCEGCGQPLDGQFFEQGTNAPNIQGGCPNCGRPYTHQPGGMEGEETPGNEFALRNMPIDGMPDSGGNSLGSDEAPGSDPGSTGFMGKIDTTNLGPSGDGKSSPDMQQGWKQLRNRDESFASVKHADVVPGPPPGMGAAPDPARPHDLEVEFLAQEYMSKGVDEATAMDMAQRKIYKDMGQPAGHGEGFSVDNLPKQWEYGKGAPGSDRVKFDSNGMPGTGGLEGFPPPVRMKPADVDQDFWDRSQEALNDQWGEQNRPVQNDPRWSSTIPSHRHRIMEASEEEFPFHIEQVIEPGPHTVEVDAPGQPIVMQHKDPDVLNDAKDRLEHEAGMFSNLGTLVGGGIGAFGGPEGALAGAAVGHTVGNIMGAVTGVGKSIMGVDNASQNAAANDVSDMAGPTPTDTEGTYQPVSAGLRSIARIVQAEDYEHPSSIPKREDTDDPEDVDPHELNDGTHDTWQKENDINDIGGTSEETQAGFDPEGPGLKMFEMVLPHIQELHAKGHGAGAGDPIIQMLDQLLEQECPGYKDDTHLADEGLKHHILNHGRKQDEGKPEVKDEAGDNSQDDSQDDNDINREASVHTANDPDNDWRCKACLKEGNDFPLPEHCPDCGSTSTVWKDDPDEQDDEDYHTSSLKCSSCHQPSSLPLGLCPYCGSIEFPMPHEAAGPQNVDQFKEVLKLLDSEGRGNEVRSLIENSEAYQPELLQVQHQQEIPAPGGEDAGGLTQQPPPPPEEGSGPGAGMPMPPPPTGIQPAGSVQSAYEMHPKDYFEDEKYDMEKVPGAAVEGPLIQLPDGRWVQDPNGWGWNNDGMQGAHEITRNELEQGMEPDPPTGVKGLWQGDRGVPFVEDEGQWGPPHQGGSKTALKAIECPECHGHTTSILDSETGYCHCSTCGNRWKVNLEPSDGQSTHHEHTAADDPNPSDVDAADQGHPDFPHGDSSTLTWIDHTGQPLQVGGTYLIYSPKYQVPDRVTIKAVKPTAIHYEQTGEFGIPKATEITKQEADMDGLQFVPVDENDQEIGGDGGDIEENNDYAGDASPNQQTDVSDSQNYRALSRNLEKGVDHGNPALDWLTDGMERTAGKNYTGYEQRELVTEPGTARNLDRLDLVHTHYDYNPEDDDDFLW